MDPTATLKEFLHACIEGNRDNAELALDALNDWVQKGGHLPKVSFSLNYQVDP